MFHGPFRGDAIAVLFAFLIAGCATQADPSPGSGGSIDPGAGGTITGAGGTAGKTGSGGTAGKTAGSGGTAGKITGSGGTAGKTAGSGGTAGKIAGSGGTTGACQSVGPTAAYSAGGPDSNEQIKNACEGGAGFICPRFMLFSPEMNKAVDDDGYSGKFHYGVATLNGQPCCSCWQIVFDRPTNTQVKYTAPRPLIVQMFNMGGADNAFDIFMGKGGMGAFTSGCPRMYSSWPSTGESFNGGIRASNMSECGLTQSTLSSSACSSAVTSACNQITSSSSYTTTITRNSCIVANSSCEMYHENWNVKARRVECPAALTAVTGCKPNAGSHPKADPAIQTASQASSWSSFTTTTMQDCCKPSCSWPGNVSGTQSGWNVFYQCRADGTPYTK